MAIIEDSRPEVKDVYNFGETYNLEETAKKI